MEMWYFVFLVVHILAGMVAVGSATLVDYLHLVGLRRKTLERGLVSIYPLVSRLINVALVFIYVSGIGLVYLNPSLLGSSLFLTKVALVLIVTVNGIYLQRAVSPHLDRCVLHGTKYCTSEVLVSSSVSGSISIVTWYSVVILSLTKTAGYSASQFIIGYLLVLAFAILTSYSLERRSRLWRD